MTYAVARAIGLALFRLGERSRGAPRRFLAALTVGLAHGLRGR